MSKDVVNISYYKETLPDLVARLKEMVENNLEVVGKNISPDLPDTRLKTALESRRMAVEDVIWACQEIDRISLELEGYEASQVDEFFEESYFRRIIPRLIKELRGMVDNCLEVVGKKLDHLKDDQLKQALMSRRVGAEDSVWASMKVDELEKLLTGINKATDTNGSRSWAKRKASGE